MNSFNVDVPEDKKAFFIELMKNLGLSWQITAGVADVKVDVERNKRINELNEEAQKEAAEARKQAAESRKESLKDMIDRIEQLRGR